jgi:hypothetical protein
VIPEKVLKHVEGVSEFDKKRYLAAWEDRNSKTKAIKAKCTECMGFEDVIKRVRECNIVICPLHGVRPFRK